MIKSLFAIKFLLCHLIGDYVLGQSDYMALNKSKQTLPCLIHCLLYTSFFLFVTISWKALLFIFVTHFIIDRFPIIVKRIIWFKNHLNPQFNYPPFKYCDTTGYHDDSPYNTYRNGEERCFGKPRHFFITIWLYIITDNTIHILCNLLSVILFC